MEIRRAQNGDIKGILELLVQVNMVHHIGRPDLFKGPTTKYSEEELKLLLLDDTKPVFVAVDGEKVLGHAFCVFQEHKGERLLEDCKTLYIDDICVDENSRGLHVGKELYQFVENFAKKEKCHNITLNVWECNPGARAFYEAMGMGVQKTGMEKIL
ncbi:GNAT family N-acetyltransferase [Butyrivibrio sp. CB08]|uniref:GNAT family N-acetyltransferase n=1 Tax=Butyrivibrio sp. CB08 TaxID=2364879 RepID=UPI000EAAA7DA|nr:GNAT family N-acetyltransferase [Butyrivibrio sp. CB08]RKM59240.1 GNAT family N-acetyltransferase [Butyrivibrio sp. CB08]